MFLNCVVLISIRFSLVCYVMTMSLENKILKSHILFETVNFLAHLERYSHPFCMHKTWHCVIITIIDGVSQTAAVRQRLFTKPSMELASLAEERPAARAIYSSAQHNFIYGACSIHTMCWSLHTQEALWFPLIAIFKPYLGKYSLQLWKVISF